MATVEKQRLFLHPFSNLKKVAFITYLFSALNRPRTGMKNFTTNPPNNSARTGEGVIKKILNGVGPTNAAISIKALGRLNLSNLYFDIFL